MSWKKVVRRLFSSHFLPLLKRAMYFGPAILLAKNGSSLKANQLSQLKSLIHSVSELEVDTVRRLRNPVLVLSKRTIREFKTLDVIFRLFRYVGAWLYFHVGPFAMSSWKKIDHRNCFWIQFIPKKLFFRNCFSIFRGGSGFSFSCILLQLGSVVHPVSPKIAGF